MATTHISHYDTDEDYERSARSLRRERRVTMLGVLGALALGLGGLLVFANHGFGRFSATPEQAPALAAPVEPTPARVEEPTPPPAVPDQAQGVNAAPPTTAAPAPTVAPVQSDRWKDMQVVDPVFEQTHHNGEEDTSTDSSSTDTPRESLPQNPYRD